MIVPDANLLLYAYDTTCRLHERARQWWEACLSGTESVGLTHPTVFAFVRMTTNPRMFVNPMTLHEASSCVKSWVARRITQVLQADADHVERVLFLLAAAASAGSNLVTDAQIAALALAHRAIVHTADRDFLRFPHLTCHYPLD